MDLTTIQDSNYLNLINMSDLYGEMTQVQYNRYCNGSWKCQINVNVNLDNGKI